MVKNLGELIPTEGTKLELGDNSAVIQLISRMLQTPAMLALQRLSPLGTNDSTYYKAGINVNEIGIRFTSQESWEKYCEKMRERFPEGFPGYGKDIEILAEVLQSLDELRALWFNNLVHSGAIRDILAAMIEAKKIVLSDMEMDDRYMLGFDEIQMQSFLVTNGLAVKVFSSKLAETVQRILDEGLYLEQRV